MPSHASAVAASVTVTTAATLDWSRYGVFQYLLTSGQAALALTFTNAFVGQRIAIVIKQASSYTSTTVTMPTGTVVGATAATATQVLTGINSAIDIIHVTCTAPGVFIATFN